MTKSSRNFVWVALVIIIFIFLTNGIYTINTVDYYRVVNTFIDVSLRPFKPFDVNLSLSAPMKVKFDSIAYSPYASSFTYIVYWYAEATSKITNTFSIVKLSWIWKSCFILSIYYLSACLGWSGWKRVFIFITFTALLSSTSNLAFFESLYQELVCLFCLPLIIGYIIKEKRSYFDHFLLFLSVLIMSCAKSQFFYLPLLICAIIAFFFRDQVKWRIIFLCVMIQALSITCIKLSSSATNYNKYHAAYLGAYAVAKSQGIKVINSDQECIGVDAWGNKLDFKDGAIPTKKGNSCYNKNRDIAFQDSLKVYLMHPYLILYIPFEKSFKDQFRYNYFHVYKRYTLAHGGGWFSNGIDKIKDSLKKEIKFFLPLIFLLSSFVLKNFRLTIGILTLSTIFYSQIYISFLGEGFRDLSKHLFLSNLSLDLIVILLISLLLTKIKV